MLAALAAGAMVVSMLVVYAVKVTTDSKLAEES